MKQALVTGSTRGIGKAIADKLEESEYHVFRNGRKPNCRRKDYIQADLTTLKGVTFLAETIQSQTQKLDCLVLNVGITCRKSLTEITPDDWFMVMDANLNMPFFLIQQLAEHMGEYGNIIFISSVLSLQPHATSIPYGVSKAAVNMLAQCLVKEFIERKIRVNVICPGFIDTEWQKEKPSWLREKIIEKVAMKRFGTPEEIADICVSLCRNTYINGAIVTVDGGYDMT